MSRVAKNPVEIPSGVTVSLNNSVLEVSGPLGSLSLTIHSAVRLLIQETCIVVERAGNSKLAKALSGTIRALVNNLVLGVTVGFHKKLVLIGTGYRVQLQGRQLVLAVGYSHPINVPLPEGVNAETPTVTEVIFRGCDKQAIGQIAASVRAFRPVERYKGKGMRYENEVVILKEVKKK